MTHLPPTLIRCSELPAATERGVGDNKQGPAQILMVKFKRFALTTAVGLGGLYIYDQTYNRRALSRTARTIFNVAVIGIDYKLNFADGKNVEALHERNADRLYRLLVANKGLYIKIGQSIAVQGNMLPLPYREKLSQLFDNAPQDTWFECSRTFKDSVGQIPDEVFAWIDHNAVASASIAQVHRARLHSGEEVAVKIQHADIKKLAWWDLSAYKAMMWFYDRVLFHIPVYFVAEYIAKQVAEETDFNIELQNSLTMEKLVQSDPQTSKSTYIPRTYPKLSSDRVLVMEWIDGTSLTNTKEVMEKFDVKQALTTIFTVLTKEAFEWGVVHCDPHPGNWILRPHPSGGKGKQQLVMLDHGLYVRMDKKLRQQYGELWRAIFHGDLTKVAEITSAWGFGEPEMFASATALQKFEAKKGDGGKQADVTSHEKFEEERKQAERFRNLIIDAERIPLVLIFVGRTQRILQGLNQIYGSPVNRMRILIDSALTQPLRGDSRYPWIYRVFDWAYRRLVLFVTDVIFSIYRVRRSLKNEDPEALFDEEMARQSQKLLTHK